MKKIISLILAIVMMAAMSVTALADDTNVTATATYPTPIYTVTIPETVDLGNIARTETASLVSQPLVVSVSGVSNLFERTITVILTSTANSFKLKNTNSDDTLDYTVYNVETGGSPISAGTAFATFMASDLTNKTGRVEIDQSTIMVAGSYSDTVTFTIGVSAAPAA